MLFSFSKTINTNLQTSITRFNGRISLRRRCQTNQRKIIYARQPGRQSLTVLAEVEMAQADERGERGRNVGDVVVAHRQKLELAALEELLEPRESSSKQKRSAATTTNTPRSRNRNLFVARLPKRAANECAIHSSSNRLVLVTVFSVFESCKLKAFWWCTIWKYSFYQNRLRKNPWTKTWNCLYEV